MAFLTLRGVKGSKLTISETDGNFLYLVFDKIQSISNISYFIY